MNSRSTKSGMSTSWLDTEPMPLGSSRKRSNKRRSGKRLASSLSRRKASVWHRPLGQVVQQAALDIVLAVAEATLATITIGNKTKSKALTVISRTEPKRAVTLVSSFAVALTGVGGAVRSLGLACVSPFLGKERPMPQNRSTTRKTFATPPAPPPPRAAFPPAYVPPPGASNGTPARPAIRPAADTFSAFMQQLYVDPGKTLLYDPTGMGMLWVQASNGAKIVAGPEAKWYFLAVLKRFEELGQITTKFNPHYVSMTRSFAEALMSHPASDPIWQTMVSDDPRTVARCFAGLDKPQNVVEVQASQLHRVSAPSGTNATTIYSV
jgi:hypothetical protein